MTIRIPMILIAIVFAAFMLAPAKVVLMLVGAGAIIFAIVSSSLTTAQSALCIAGGVILIGFGIRSIVLEKREEVEQARKAAESVARRPVR